MQRGKKTQSNNEDVGMEDAMKTGCRGLELRITQKKLGFRQIVYKCNVLTSRK